MAGTEPATQVRLTRRRRRCLEWCGSRVGEWETYVAFFSGLLPWSKRANSAGRPRESVLPLSAPRRLGIMVLEPRMMYDAAAAATVAAAAEAHHDAAPDVAASVAAAEKQAAPAVSNTGVP